MAIKPQANRSITLQVADATSPYFLPLPFTMSRRRTLELKHSPRQTSGAIVQEFSVRAQRQSRFEQLFGSPIKIHCKRQRVLQVFHHLCGKPADPAFKARGWQRP